MFGLSASHLVILFIIVLLFGSRKLPELGSSVGKTVRNFKKGLEGLDSDEDPNRKSIEDQKKDPSNKA